MIAWWRDLLPEDKIITAFCVFGITMLLMLDVGMLFLLRSHR
jgi:hypothetical protein